jgi:hypothetical protein
MIKQLNRYFDQKFCGIGIKKHQNNVFGVLLARNIDSDNLKKSY